jgi:adenylate cyclase
MPDAPTRRLAAILAADVAGYSRLMGADESGTLDALKRQLSDSVHPAIAAHSGRIFKTTGDGLLAEFASAVEAVLCAVEIQRALAERSADAPAGTRLDFRIGINLGDVIADGDDVFGDGVNVAARLEPLAEPGGICVSSAVYQQVTGKVDVAFVDMGARNLKNIAEPVRVFRIDLQRGAPAAGSLPPPDDRPSIAVMPFENLSGDGELELVADGLVEDVIALLARVAGFFVVARSSSFAYREGHVDVRQIGRELGVRYVVQGSVRAAGSQVRINVQLLEADAARQLWTGRFDTDRSQTFDLQDNIAHAIIRELEPQLTRADLTVIKRQRPANLDAWSRFRMARGVMASKGWNEESAAEAIDQLRQTVKLAPDFALAHAYLALLIAFAAAMSMIEDTPAVRAEAKAYAERAIALDPNGSEVVGLAGCAIADLGEDVRGTGYLERAIELDPSNAQARVALGAAEVRLGRLDAGIENMRLGMQRSPRDGRLGFWSMMLAAALLKANRVEQALAEASAACRRDVSLYSAQVVAADALVRLDRRDEARQAVAEAKRIRPTLSPGEIEKFFGAEVAADLNPLLERS